MIMARFREEDVMGVAEVMQEVTPHAGSLEVVNVAESPFMLMFHVVE